MTLLISLQGGARTAVTLMVSSVLFAAAHAVYPFGILTYAVLGMSFGLAYVWHKNIYAMMSVHFIVNLLGNGIPILWWVATSMA
ncbi:CPBP family intramembrane metalloprotease [Propionibacterium australiense]|uniref:CPBP family intramembrane metalloprotease n=1 Tax=Propionibacterium australiense TaxID=119981 RepID=A0A8B3FNP0_9ACTN|nr:CPBP family intramembrane metalloprotease [Propionibacterium australiense]